MDLPIALGLMAALEAIPADALNDYVVAGELRLDGTAARMDGVLPATVGANAVGKDPICLMIAGRRGPGQAAISMSWRRAI